MMLVTVLGSIQNNSCFMFCCSFCPPGSLPAIHSLAMLDTCYASNYGSFAFNYLVLIFEIKFEQDGSWLDHLVFYPNKYISFCNFLLSDSISVFCYKLWWVSIKIDWSICKYGLPLYLIYWLLPPMYWDTFTPVNNSSCFICRRACRYVSRHLFML